MTSREICKVCWHENAVGFTVPDGVWRAVAPTGVNVLCIGCFARIADAKRVQWDSAIAFYPVSLKTHLEYEGYEDGR